MSTGYAVLALRPTDAARMRGVLRESDRAAPVPMRDSAAPVRWFRASEAVLKAGAANRWTYTLVEGVYDPETDAMVDLDGGLTGTGLNTIESANSATRAGPGVELDTLPAGWTIYPVGWTKSNDEVPCYFPAWPVWTPDNEVVWLFTVPNPIDGACAE